MLVKQVKEKRQFALLLPISLLATNQKKEKILTLDPINYI